MKEFSFRETLLEFAKRAKNDYEKLASKIPEKSQQLGEIRENILKEFLALYLPERFGVDSGFVVDANDNSSSQIDIIIFDKNITPPIKISGKRICPIEGVVAIGEVKSNIDDKKTLDKAINQVLSIKDLSKKGTSSIGYTHASSNFDKTYHSQIFKFVFCDSLPSENFMLDYLGDFYNKKEKKEWVDLVGSFNSGAYSLFKRNLSEKINEDANIDDAEGFYHKTSEKDGGSFLTFFLLLYNAIIGKDIGYPNVIDYLNERDPKEATFEHILFEKNYINKNMLKDNNSFLNQQHST